MPTSLANTTAYDAVPYPIYTFPATNPARLGAASRLFRCKAGLPEDSRVLELGCAKGVNLMAMAQVFPEAEFVGIDASRNQITEGEEILAKLGVNNVRLIATDLSRLEEDIGQFDYIIAHGLFSWVPKHVQEAIFKICQDRLKPEGVAYISYNCLPGWRMRGALRDMMLMHVRDRQDPAEQVQQSKALLKFLAEACPEESPYGKYLRSELQLIAQCDDGYIAHDFLEEENDPYYFTDFLRKAAEFDLQYLGESDPSTMFLDNLPEQAATTLKSLNLPQVAVEQYMDFVRNRMFRSTLLCRKTVAIDRNVKPDRLDDLQAIALVAPQPLQPGQTQKSFANAAGTQITPSSPVVVTLLENLAAKGQQPTPVSEAVDQAIDAQSEDFIKEAGGRESLAEQLKMLLLQGYFRRLVDLVLGPLSCRQVEGTNPDCLPLARWQATNHMRVTTAGLDMVSTDPFTRKVIELADGSRTYDELVSALVAANAQQDFTVREGDKPITDTDKLRASISQLLALALSRFANVGLVQPAAVPTAEQIASRPAFEPVVMPDPASESQS
jgi:methyltransferase-like protein/2-polyprenyl-3-methyl-5-hydroxy-6-metoxy-1,4-benzoquinol methylase